MIYMGEYILYTHIYIYIYIIHIKYICMLLALPVKNILMMNSVSWVWEKHFSPISVVAIVLNAIFK